MVVHSEKGISPGALAVMEVLMLRYFFFLLFVASLMVVGCKNHEDYYHRSGLACTIEKGERVRIDHVTMTPVRNKQAGELFGFVVGKYRFMPYSYEACVKGEPEVRIPGKGGTKVFTCPKVTKDIVLLKHGKGRCTIVQVKGHSRYVISHRR